VQAGLVLVAFSPVLAADFLNYDDPWLLRDNPFFGARAAEAPWRAIFDFGLETRLAFGAEYLPVRDLCVWLLTRMCGLDPHVLHAVSLGLYIAGTCFVYGALLHTLADAQLARAASLLFALHPVHVESVGWLSGQKDVLALFFSMAALYVHARGMRYARALVPLLLVLASFSKSMAIAVVPLLLVHDAVRGRRTDRLQLGLLVLGTACSLALHLHVGRIVHMVAAPAGGSPLTAAMTMGPVPLRYLGLLLYPTRTSIVHSVPDLAAWSWPSLAGFAFAAGSLALVVARRSALLGLAWAWFWLPLLPVSQLILPLQNRMADRYLLFSALGPMLVCAAQYRAALLRLTTPLVQSAVSLLGALTVLSLGLVSFERSVVFTDSVLLFSDALQKAPDSALVPYQLGKAWEARGESARAEEAYAEALIRGLRQPERSLSMAANNLANLRYRRGQLDGAEDALSAALTVYPRKPKLLRNLEKVRAAKAARRPNP
jgi:hypothetical protein